LDAYNPGYGVPIARLSTAKPWALAHCWPHWRRRFVRFGQDTPSPICDEMIARIASLYAIEKEIRGRDPATRRAVRQKLSKPIVQALRPWLEACLQDLSSANELARHIRYGLKRWDGPTRFLEDGRLEMDTNGVENAIRPIPSAESSCPPSSTVWKHLHLLLIATVTRTPLPPEGAQDVVRFEIGGPDLPRRAGNDLLGGQDPVLNHPSHDVAGHAEPRSGLAHGEPDAVRLGRSEGMDAADPADGGDTMCRPGLLLASPHAHPVQGGRNVGVGEPRRHPFHHCKSLLGGLAAMLSGSRLPDAQLRVLAAAPVDRQDHLAGDVVDIGADARDQRPDQVLAASRRHARRRPRGSAIRSQTCEVGHRHRRIGGVHRHKARPAGLHAAQRGLPGASRAAPR
jgi:hypothetical protein